MGLGKYDIDLIYGDQETPPAFIENTDNKYMMITFSRNIEELRELLSTLVHELSHVSVWTLDPSLIFRRVQKKVRASSTGSQTSVLVNNFFLTL